MAASVIKDWTVASSYGEVTPENSWEAPEEVEREVITTAELSIIQKLLRTTLVETKEQRLEVLRNDPSSPFFSAATFEELNLREELLKGVYAMGFNSPSRIQEAALPMLLHQPPQNLIAQSQSGTGKTAAFVLAMLSRVNPNEHYPQVICLSPTYELARQTMEVVKAMAKFLPEITVILAVKEEPAPQEPLHQHIIIGTPGKMTDWAFRSKVFDPTKITVFVLDEADVMLFTTGFHDQCIKLNRKLSPNCQRMLFSATYENDVMDFALTIINDANVIKLERKEENLENIKQVYVRCRNSTEKYDAIAKIYGAITIGGAMIFCRTKKTAHWLAGKLTVDGHAVAVLSSDLDISQRIDVLQRFRESKEKIIVTTNVLARGIDVEQVSMVVNYDVPLDINDMPDCESYLHRIGRTGRFGKAGLALNLIESDRNMKVLQYFEDYFKIKINKLDADDQEALERLELA